MQIFTKYTLRVENLFDIYILQNKYLQIRNIASLFFIES